MHRRQKYVHVLLSPDLRKEHGKRNVQVKTGDTVRIMRGDHAGTEGLVEDVDLKRCAIKVAGVSNYRSDGTEVPRTIHPSNVMITKLDLDDERRGKSISR